MRERLKALLLERKVDVLSLSLSMFNTTTTKKQNGNEIPFEILFHPIEYFHKPFANSLIIVHLYSLDMFCFSSMLFIIMANEFHLPIKFALLVYVCVILIVNRTRLCPNLNDEIVYYYYTSTATVTASAIFYHYKKLAD